jgi:hypothetical protein
MLQRANEKRLYINNVLQKYEGNDTDFKVNLGSLF